MSSDENQLRDHAFDGIQEYDNNLPLWWQAIFYLSIVFAVVYVAWYHFGPGQLGVERLETQLAAAQEQRLAQMEELDEETLRGFLSDRSRVNNGRRLYAVHNCAQCHQADGLGSIGPSLRDDYWRWGSDMIDIYTTIKEGRNNNTMPAHSIPQGELIDLTVFVVDWNTSEKAPGRGVRIEGAVLDPIEYHR